MSKDLVTQALTALRDRNYLAALDAINGHAQSEPFNIQHYLIKGLSQIALLQWADAEETFTRAIKAFPHQPQLWLNHGIVKENLAKINEAAESYEECIGLDPEQPQACGNLSNIYRKQGRFAESERMAHAAYEKGADKAQALNSLGLALGKQGKFYEAEKVFQQALSLASPSSITLGNLANLAIDQLDFCKAWPLFAAASLVNKHSIIQRDEGMAHLLAGNFATGWPLYEERLGLPGALRIKPACPRYNNQSLCGKKLLVIAEQGLGDTIMFCRYGKYLADQGAILVWAVQKSLQPLLSGQLPGDVLSETDELPATDYYLPMLTLPLATQKLMPSDVSFYAYLKATITKPPPKKNKGTRNIGLIWSGSPTHERDHERSFDLLKLEPIWKNIAANYFALFKGCSLNEITTDIPVISLSDQICDFADTAAWLNHMDIIISVDTAVAHLAGAMGIETHLLLPYCPDWRWGTAGSTTPWYPSVKLYRQPSYGDWESVIKTLGDSLSI